MHDIRIKLRKLLADHFGLDESQITDDAHFLDDLDIDSLDAVELVTKIEDTFQISIPDDDAAQIQTVRDFVAYLLNRGDDDPGTAGIPAKLPPKPPPPNTHHANDE